jgi:hypothetical protein
VVSAVLEGNVFAYGLQECGNDGRWYSSWMTVRILTTTGDFELNVGPTDIHKGLLSVVIKQRYRDIQMNSMLDAASPKPKTWHGSLDKLFLDHGSPKYKM